MAYTRPSTVVEWDATGKLLFSTALDTAVPDATNFNIVDVTAAPNGTVVASVTATSAESAHASLLVWIDTTGRVLRVVRSSPFAARRLLFTPNGVLWAVGRVSDNQYNTVRDSDLVRRYGSNGILIGSALPHSQFALAEEVPSLESFLTTDGTIVAVYCASTQEYAELAMSTGDVVRARKLSLPKDSITGAHLVGSDKLAIGRADKKGLQVYLSDRTSGAAELADSSTATNGLVKPTFLIGRDGDSLVYYGKSPAHILWVSVVNKP